jgi:hypothetical protein
VDTQIHAWVDGMGSGLIIASLTSWVREYATGRWGGLLHELKDL